MRLSDAPEAYHLAGMRGWFASLLVRLLERDQDGERLPRARHRIRVQFMDGGDDLLAAIRDNDDVFGHLSGGDRDGFVFECRDRVRQALGSFCIDAIKRIDQRLATLRVTVDGPSVEKIIANNEKGSGDA